MKGLDSGAAAFMRLRLIWKEWNSIVQFDKLQTWSLTVQVHWGGISNKTETNELHLTTEKNTQVAVLSRWLAGEQNIVFLNWGERLNQ